MANELNNQEKNKSSSANPCISLVAFGNNIIVYAQWIC